MGSVVVMYWRFCCGGVCCSDVLEGGVCCSDVLEVLLGWGLL